MDRAAARWRQVVPEIGDCRTWTCLTKPLLPRGVQLPAAIEEGQWMRLGSGTIRPRLGYRLPRAGRRQVFREAWACCCRHFGRGLGRLTVRPGRLLHQAHLLAHGQERNRTTTCTESDGLHGFSPDATHS